MNVQPDHIAVRKIKYSVEYAVRSDKTMPARVFLLSLPIVSQRRLLATFQHVASNGETNVSPALFKHERDEIWTFKGKLDQGDLRKGKHKRAMVRMPCFRRNDRWIITHGFFKPNQSEWPEEEFTLAFEIMKEVIAREVNQSAIGKGGNKR